MAMSIDLSFDAPKGIWKAELENQKALYAEFFIRPMSIAGMEYFKAMLELIAKRAVNVGNIQGFFKFIDAVEDKNAKALMLTWIETYTPIRAHLSSEGLEQFHVVQAYRNRCSLIDGKAHPFYSLKEKPRKHKSHPGSRMLVADSEDNDLFSVSAPARTELDFEKKIIKTSLNRFFADRSVENRNKLISAIQRIPLEGTKKKGSPFLQGGAVGSKR